MTPAGAQSYDFARPSPSTAGSDFEKPRIGKMIPSEGGERFIDNQIFTTFYDEVMR
jgi:hypothetical protein